MDRKEMDKRKTPRSKTYAKVLVESRNAPGYLRDLSREGCRIALLRPIAVEKAQTLELAVIPGPEIGIPTFRISLQVLWTQADPLYFFMGGRISVAPEYGQNLQKLYDYYTGNR